MNGLFPPPWEESGYADVVQVELDGEDIKVEFGNGDVVVLPARRLGLVRPSNAEPTEDQLGVRATVGDRHVDVSWTQIRAASDSDFAHEMRKRDAEEARRIGLRLKALREDLNITQRSLAEQVGMPPAQLAKIESGMFDLRLSTVNSLLRAMGASLADIAGRDVPEVSGRQVAKRAEAAGVPKEVAARLLAAVRRSDFVGVIARAFGWAISDLLAGHIESPRLAFEVQFKAGDAEAASKSPLIGMAHRICEWAIQASDLPPNGKMPNNADDLRRVIVAESQRLTLRTVAEWAWNAGIPVVPVAARGAFAAASWKVGTRPVIVLKDSRPAAAFWLFDLAHELGHVALGHVRTRGVVDVDSPTLNTTDAQESAANQFALDLLLTRPRELLAAIRADARGDYMRFKFSVEKVAREADVSVGVLGMVAAYELKEIGEYKDRWGSATNLARPEGIGQPLLAATFRDHVQLERLAEADRQIIEAVVLAPDGSRS